MKLLTIYLLIINFSLMAEDRERLRDENVNIPDVVLRAYSSYWENVYKGKFKSILMSGRYKGQADLDKKVIKHYAPNGRYKIKPTYYETLKKDDKGSTLLISADIISLDGTILRRETGCHFVRLEDNDSKVRFVSYMGDCLDN